MMPRDPASPWQRFRAAWGALSRRARERVLLASLVALSLAFRDALLFVFAGGLFAAFEIGHALAAPKVVARVS